MKFLPLLLLLVGALQSQGEYSKTNEESGVQAEVKISGLQAILDVLVPVIVEELEGTQIPDVSGIENIAVIGDIDYELSRIILTSIDFQNILITLPSETISLDVAGVVMRIDCAWEFEKRGFPWIPYGGGTARVDISNSDFYIRLSTGVNAIGQPTAQVSDIDVVLRNINIDISGSFFSWLYNFLLGVFSGTVNDLLTDVLQTEISTMLDDTLKELTDSFETILPLDDVSQLNYALTHAPEYTNRASLLAGIAGEFQNPNDPQPIPLPRIPFPVEPVPRDAHVWMDQFTINSYLYIHYEQDRMNLIVTENDVPDDIGDIFNTREWVELVPNLPATYPDRPMRIELIAQELPLVEMKEGLAEFDSKLNFKFEVNLSDDENNPEWVDAFVLAVDFAAAMTAEVTSVPGEIKLLVEFVHPRFTAEEFSSNIGEINVFLLNYVLTELIADTLMPFVNDFFEDGLALPDIEGLSVIEPNLFFKDAHIAIDTDLAFEATDKIRDAIHDSITRVNRLKK